MKISEQMILERLNKAQLKLNKAENEVAMWEELLKIVQLPQQKLT